MATTTFTSGTVITSDWLNDVDRVTYQDGISILAFTGVTGVAGEDQTAGIALARAYCAANAPMTLKIPKGTYEATDFGNWAITGLTLDCNAGAKFKLTGNNDTVLYLKAFPNDLSSDPFISQFNIRGELLVEGNSNTLYGVRAYGLRACRWDRVRVMNLNSSNGCAFSIDACSVNNFGSLICSLDTDTMTSIPALGLRITTGTRQGVNLGRSTNNVFEAVDFGGVPIGIHIVSGDENVFIAGTAEGTAGTPPGPMDRALTIDAGNRYNLFIGTSFESVTGTYAVVDAGDMNGFLGCYAHDGHIFLQGRSSWVRGGLWKSITTDTTAYSADLKNLTWNYTAGGSFTDNGHNTDWKGLWNEQTSSYHYPLKARTSIVSGATSSPTAWTNNTGGWVELICQSGTISAPSTRSRNGVAFDIPRVTPMIMLVAPNEVISISHGGSLDLSYLPMNGLPG